MSIISNAPYYDRYDRKKKYTQLLAVPGRVAQAREITELQSTLKDIIKSLGDSIMSDGNVIEGCQVIPDKTRKRVTVTPGRLYMSGMVLELLEQSLDIEATGTEIIGVRLKETIIYESDDPDLRDPALGFENYNQPGCDRLRSELEIVKVSNPDDSSVAVLATIIDGELAVEQLTPQYSPITEVLARRTFDESGSYIVEGLNVRVESNTSDGESFDVVLEPGKAYVNGYEITIPSTRRVSMPRSTTSSRVTARYNYASGSNYLLTTGPYVKEIISVTGTAKSVESVTINSSQGAALQRTNAYSIISVTKDGETIDPSSYRLEQGPTSYIRWNDSAYPGDNVVVTYYYTNEFVQDTDYILSLVDNNHYLKWIGTSEPIVGESLIIIYDKYLARKDTAYIDQYGNVNVVQGTPADYGQELAPDAPAYTLPLASIMSPPGGDINIGEESSINVSNVGLTRFTMQDIHKLLNRIRTIEYDQTVLSLNTEAKEYGTDDKRGIFTDPFIDLSKVALTFNMSNGNPIVEGTPTFDTTIDLDSNMVYLPLLNSYMDMTYDEGRSTVSRYNRVVTIHKTGETVALSQMKATKSFLVSPYLVAPQAPEVFISPSVDMWYDDTVVTLPVDINSSKVVSSSTRNVYTSSGTGNRSTTTTSTTVQTTSVGNTVERLVEENVLSESAVTYIRPRVVTVTGNHYPPSLDNIKCYFEGVEAPLTPVGDTSSGTLAGSVKANSDGRFTASFTIPDKVLTGTRVVSLESSTTVEGYKSSAFTFYQASGIARNIQRTVTTITTVLLNRVTTLTHNTNYSYDPDPLAQTFILDKMTLLSGIDVYFESVPSSNAPVTCEIREVVNGNITATIYGFKSLTADEIRANVSADGSVATRFNFNDPVLIEPNKEYAFVLKSSSQDYRVFVAEIGEVDILTKETVLANPYLLGVMMSSSNNSSWTNHQKSDVKFRLISDVYSHSSDLYFYNVPVSQGFCRAILSAESIILDGTNIKWSYSLDNGNTWLDITPYNMKVLDQLAQEISLKATLSRESKTDLTPILALDTVNLSLACYDNSSEGYYISNLISGLDEYSQVELILDTNEPGSTNIKAFISSSNNNDAEYTLVEAAFQSAKEKNYGWFEKTYRATLSSPATQCRIFVKLSSSNKYHTPSFRKLRAIMS